MASQKHAKLYRMVTEQHICPFGIKAKDLLEREGYVVEDHHLTTREDTDAFKAEHGVKTTPQTFIEGQRIGGYDDVQVYFGKRTSHKADETSYTPVIAVFAVTFLMALATGFATGDALISVVTLERFISFSMCVLAILKLMDMESFTNQFVTYDLLARRWVRYAYIYPFAEALAGVGMIAHAFIFIVAPLALFIGSIGAVSVIKAVYIEKRDIKCACVGGNSKVPLGFLSLTENLMMIAMGLWMLF